MGEQLLEDSPGGGFCFCRLGGAGGAAFFFFLGGLKALKEGGLVLLAVFFLMEGIVFLVITGVFSYCWLCILNLDMMNFGGGLLTGKRDFDG